MDHHRHAKALWIHRVVVLHTSNCLWQFGVFRKQGEDIEQVGNQIVSHILMPPCLELSVKPPIRCGREDVGHLNKKLKNERITVLVTVNRLHLKPSKANGIRDERDYVIHRFLRPFINTSLRTPDRFSDGFG